MIDKLTMILGNIEGFWVRPRITYDGIFIMDRFRGAMEPENGAPSWNT